MRIACPSCDTTYEVPDSRLTPGKMVRCARCNNQWLPARDDDAAAPPRSAATAMPDAQAVTATAETAPGAMSATAPPELTATATPESTAAAPPAPTATAMDRLTASAQPAHSPHRGLIVAWALSLIVLAGAIAAAMIWRDAVVRAWPPSGRILATTSPTPPPPGQTAGKKPE